MMSLARPIFAAVVLLLAAGCEDDPRKAQDGAKWLQDRYMFRSFGDIGTIEKIYVEEADLIRLEVRLSSQEHADAINAKSLILQSLIARYACPTKASQLWEILGEDVRLRVDLKLGTEQVASAFCEPE